MARPFSLAFLGRRVEVHGRVGEGFQVHLLFCPGGDELWETIYHNHRFDSKEAAERLAAKVRAAKEVDLDHWGWGVTRCSPFGFLHNPPVRQAA